MITFQRGLDKWYFSGERLNSSLSLYLKVVIDISSLRMDWGSLFQRVAPLQLNRLLPYFRSRVVGMSSLYVCLSCLLVVCL